MTTNRTRVYVGGISEEVRERDVEDFFQGFGRITEVAIKNRYCFVEFRDQQDAEDAIRNLNDRKLLGRRVVVQKARKPRSREQYPNHRRFSRNSHRFSPARRTNFRVTIENLSSRLQWQDLKDFLTKVGKVTYAKAHNLRRHQGMVEFETYDDMKRVIEELNGAELNGRNIIIKEATDLSRSRSRSPLRRLQSPIRSRSPVDMRDKSISRSRSPVKRSISPEKETKNLRKRSRENSEEESGRIAKKVALDIDQSPSI